MKTSLRCIVFLFAVLVLGGSSKGQPQNNIRLIDKASVPATFSIDDTAGCGPHCATFINTTVGAVGGIKWNFGDGSIVTVFSDTIKHCYLFPGNYTVALTITDINGATFSSTQKMYVYQKVVADFSASPQPTTIKDPVITFTDLSTGLADSWQWSFGDLGNTTSNAQNPVMTYMDTLCYNVTLIANNQDNCPDTVTKIICVYPEPEYKFEFPNVFSPNGDGVNDLFRPLGTNTDFFQRKLVKRVSVNIYDRWGVLMCEWKTVNGGWDGRTTAGIEASAGVYYYIAESENIYSELFEAHGFVTLLR